MTTRWCAEEECITSGSDTLSAIVEGSSCRGRLRSYVLLSVVPVGCLLPWPPIFLVCKALLRPFHSSRPFPSRVGARYRPKNRNHRPCLASCPDKKALVCLNDTSCYFSPEHSLLLQGGGRLKSAFSLWKPGKIVINTRPIFCPIILDKKY